MALVECIPSSRHSLLEPIRTTRTYGPYVRVSKMHPYIYGLSIRVVRIGLYQPAPGALAHNPNPNPNPIPSKIQLTLFWSIVHVGPIPQISRQSTHTFFLYPVHKQANIQTNVGQTVSAPPPAMAEINSKLAATLRGSRPGVQSASLIMTSLMTS